MDEARRSHLGRLPLGLPRLGRRMHDVSGRSRRNRLGAFGQRQGGGDLPTWRSIREAASACRGVGHSSAARRRTMWSSYRRRVEQPRRFVVTCDAEFRRAAVWVILSPMAIIDDYPAIAAELRRLRAEHNTDPPDQATVVASDAGTGQRRSATRRLVSQISRRSSQAAG